MLRWSLENGAAYRTLRKAGSEIPGGLEPPELLPGLGGWYDDFLELSTDRQIGMGIGPIPASSIARHTAGWPEDDADAFRTCIRAMDAVYLDHAAGKGRDRPSPDLAGSDNPARDAFRAAFRGRSGRYRGAH